MNAKNKKIIMILLTALVIAVIGGIALYMYLVPQKTTVYVFNDNYQQAKIPIHPPDSLPAQTSRPC